MAKKKKVEEKWFPLGDLIVSEDMHQIHCDTRDFYCITDTEKTSNPDIKVFLKNRKLGEEYIIKPEEISPWLKMLESISNEGIENVSWRFLSFNNFKDGFWVKYIRFYKYGKTGNYIVTDGYSLIPWRELNEETLLKEYLNAD